MSMRADSRGIGGFTEAILALMVVTVGVMLLSLSLAIDATDIMEGSEQDLVSEGVESLSKAIRTDVSIWRGDRLVWTSLQLKNGSAYVVPAHCRGYIITIEDLAEHEEWSISCGASIDEHSDVVVSKTPIRIMGRSGTIDAGLMIIEVW